MLTTENAEKPKVYNTYTKLTTYSFYFYVVFFPILALFMPAHGFIVPGERLISKIFGGVDVYSLGSFDPGLSKTYFTILYISTIALMIAFITTWRSDLASKEDCIILIDRFNEKFKSRRFYFTFGIFFLISGYIVLILSNFGVIPKPVSIGAFTGYGLSLRDMATASLAQYFIPMYRNRIGLAFSGEIIAIYCWISIIVIPLLFRVLRCVFLARG